MSAPRIVLARTFAQRFFGWMGRAIPADEGLLLAPCSSVHTFFMRGPIDVVFLDQRSRVLRSATLAAWRMAWQRGARMVLELPAGGYARLGSAVIEAAVDQATTLRSGTQPGETR